MSASTFSLPDIIQGGMGVAISDWSLARAVSRTGAGNLGVVSGTGLATVLARRLQTGDSEGHFREALKAFPIPEIAEKVLKQYFIPGGKEAEAPFRLNPVPNLANKAFIDLTVVANFVEVHLAKRGHNGEIGINLLEKIQIPTLASLFGAMLAGVDYVLMGAGIPRSIPGALDRLAAGEEAELKLDVQGARDDDRFVSKLNPGDYDIGPESMKRPAFIGIVSSTVLAKTLALRASGKVDGLIVEGPPAGGHNAPPRGALQLSESGEPVFNERDLPDLKRIHDLGLPFWLAGAYGRPGMLEEAKARGATGIQVGTAFAFCEESGMLPEIKKKAIRQSREGTTRVFTDPYASPTGFPIKAFQAEGTLSEKSVYEQRKRICDLGYLRTLYRKEDGSIGYRCPAEPVDDYVRKGGRPEATEGRACICNGLFGDIGLSQIRDDGEEPAFITVGDDVARIAEFLPPGKDSYHASDVVAHLRSGSTEKSHSS
ncbi:MAG: nitronate monooxygenase [Opitutales bacterium]